MSYDVSKNFSKNQHAGIKDQFCFSPSYNENYDYKKGVVKEFHIGGVMSMKEPMEGQYARKKASEQARMEQDR
jgi:hypothetical protein